MKFNTALTAKAELVNTILSDCLAARKDNHPDIHAAMNYTLRAPGKRIRGILVLYCCELICGRINPAAKTAAAAIEMIHTYSLIHDDLPAIDNDNMRRGRPSCHKAFDEATAILAGDALLTLAFETLALDIPEPQIAVKIIAELARSAGSAGMIGGQIADIKGQNTAGTQQILDYIHTNKTAKLFQAACAIGAVAAHADQQQYDHIARYGLNLGLAFQVADDILDLSATTQQLGKTAGKDTTQGKLTYPFLLGMEESQKIAARLVENAINALDIFGPAAQPLTDLAKALLERSR
ncbi:MAG: polyprenyl synthetase family protein [Planctomycetota bacterium]